MTRVDMSTLAEPSSASVITCSCSPARPTARPSTDGSVRAAMPQQQVGHGTQLPGPRPRGRVVQRETRSAAAACSIRSAITGHGLSRSDRLITQ